MKSKEDEIKKYLDEGLTLDSIYEVLLKDENLIKYKKWKEEAKLFIYPNPVLDREIQGMTEKLYPIFNFAQKFRLIDHFRNNKYN